MLVTPPNFRVACIEVAIYALMRNVFYCWE